VVVISSFWVYGTALSFLCLVFSSLTGEILGVGGLRVDTWTYDCLLEVRILYTSYDATIQNPNSIKLSLTTGLRPLPGDFLLRCLTTARRIKVTFSRYTTNPNRVGPQRPRFILSEAYDRSRQMGLGVLYSTKYVFKLIPPRTKKGELLALAN
jgi:hypothetical protein